MAPINDRLTSIKEISYPYSYLSLRAMRKYIQYLFSFAILSLFALEEEDLNWEDAGPSVLEFNGYLQEAIREGDWWAAIDYAELISYHFPESPFAFETAFLIGEAYFKLGELELANERFTSYLNHSPSPKHFEEAIHYKFSIAESFRSGVKKPLFSSHKLPKLVSGEEDALKIYEEVITSLPHDDIAAKSLLGKAEIQSRFEEYKESLETLDLLIRRFPKHDLAAQGFIEKSHAYLMQCREKSLDPALLDLAEVNLRKFRLAFPREERIAKAEKDFAEMQEIFAEHLMETGRFFQKTKKVPASIIYYSKVLSKYPESKAASEAKERLESLQASGKL
jgi:outer membrane assembly lipoprotein YfiO